MKNQRKIVSLQKIKMIIPNIIKNLSLSDISIILNEYENKAISGGSNIYAICQQLYPDSTPTLTQVYETVALIALELHERLAYQKTNKVKYGVVVYDANTQLEYNYDSCQVTPIAAILESIKKHDTTLFPTSLNNVILSHTSNLEGITDTNSNQIHTAIHDLFDGRFKITIRKVVTL